MRAEMRGPEKIVLAEIEFDLSVECGLELGTSFAMETLVGASRKLKEKHPLDREHYYALRTWPRTVARKKALSIIAGEKYIMFMYEFSMVKEVGKVNEIRKRIKKLEAQISSPITYGNRHQHHQHRVQSHTACLASWPRPLQG